MARGRGLEGGWKGVGDLGRVMGQATRGVAPGWWGGVAGDGGGGEGAADGRRRVAGWGLQSPGTSPYHSALSGGFARDQSRQASPLRPRPRPPPRGRVRRPDRCAHPIIRPRVHAGVQIAPDKNISEPNKSL